MPQSTWQFLWRAHGLWPIATTLGVHLGVRNGVHCRTLSGLVESLPRWPNPTHQKDSGCGCHSSIGAECSYEDEKIVVSCIKSGGDVHCRSGSQIRDHHFLRNIGTALCLSESSQSIPIAQQVTSDHYEHDRPLRATSVPGKQGPTNAFAGSVGLSGRTFSLKVAQDFRESAKCWSCESAKAADILFFCDQCGAIQPASDTADYFQLLGVEPTFMVDLPAIEGRYKALQRKLHPDMYATKQKVEQDFSAEQSSLVNKAYSTLVNPLSRAVYLLQMRGVEAGDGEEGTMSDIELLSEVMEIREAIEEAEDIRDLQNLHQENAEKMRQSGAAFSAALQDGDLKQALECVHRMTYWDRIDKEITRKL